VRAGYSLLEVLLSVALIALSGAIAAPSIIAGLDRREADLALVSLEAGITGLRQDAVLGASPLEIGPGDVSAYFAGLPAGWQVEAEGALRLSAGGLCDSPAELILSSPDRRQWRRLSAPPDCALARP
jgi:prepilin-type N-terminal cleavage/methylation domain-containing protein